MEKKYDLIIIGGGAAGLMAAVMASRAGLTVALMERNAECGKKLLLTGGGRCNITHDGLDVSAFHSTTSRNKIRKVLTFFDDRKTREFFSELGIQCIREKSGSYFTNDGSAHSVRDALLRQLKNMGVTIYAQCLIRSCTYKNNTFHIKNDTHFFTSPSLLIATGGRSYPHTGSDGAGYALVRAFRHTLIPPRPALAPLILKPHPFRELAGVSFVGRLTLWEENKKVIAYEGSLLFTHQGLSGFPALNMSRHINTAKHDTSQKITCSFLPQMSSPERETHLFSSPKKRIRSALRSSIPQRLADALLDMCCIARNLTCAQISKDVRKKLVLMLTAYPLTGISIADFTKAEITAGGISLDEVTAPYLESHLIKGLFFSGEMLDVDAVVGGYNLQWAWSSGVAAAQGVIRFLKK